MSKFSKTLKLKYETVDDEIELSFKRFTLELQLTLTLIKLFN